jgi:hypothetical protein
VGGLERWEAIIEADSLPIRGEKRLIKADGWMYA